jgi:hypothetical protein
MGGQTALNCALDLWRNGVLDKYKVELIGATPEAIDKAEDRLKFKDAMTKIGLGSARSGIAHAGRGLGGAEDRRLPGGDSPQLHARRHRAAASPTTRRSSRPSVSAASKPRRPTSC